MTANPFTLGARVLIKRSAGRYAGGRTSWSQHSVTRVMPASGRFLLTNTGKQQYRPHEGREGWHALPTGKSENYEMIWVYPWTPERQAEMDADQHEARIRTRAQQVAIMLDRRHRELPEALLVDLEAALRKAGWLDQ